MTNQPHDELSWTALQYSLGELPEAEAAEFEARLETDSSAQTALAQAVALAAAVKLAAPVKPAEESIPARGVVAPISVSGDDGFGRRAAGWLLLATAASVALWFAASQPRHEARDQQAAQVRVGEAQHALAVAWAAGQPTEEELVVGEETMPEEDMLAEAESTSFIEEPSAPDWLIAALVDAHTSPVRGEN